MLSIDKLGWTGLGPIKDEKHMNMYVCRKSNSQLAFILRMFEDSDKVR